MFTSPALLRRVVTAFLAAAGLVNAAWAQDKPAAEGNLLPIGLLNVQRISQKYKPFVEQAAELQEEAQELQKNVALKQSELETVGSRLQKVERDSPEFQKLQSQYVKLQREAQIFIQENQQKLREKDLKLSLSLHREIAEVLKSYCKQKGLRLVVRVDNYSLEENQPAQQIAQALGRGVLYDDRLDITDDVLKLLEQQKPEKKP